MLRQFVRRLGIVKTSVVVTVIAVLFSVGISAGVEFITRGAVSIQVIIFAVTMPVFIAPIFNYFFLRLVFQLEDLQAQLRELAIRDGLTGAFNRRHWMEQAETELARAKRYPQTFSILLFDLDNFKRINDTHGHLAGDLVLREVSRVCMSHSRKVDVFARYGGEEFVFLLPQADPAHAWSFAERIRATVAATPVAFDHRAIPITMSIGVVTFVQGAGTLDDLLMRADRALYFAKNAGKNRSVAAETLG